MGMQLLVVVAWYKLGSTTAQQVRPNKEMFWAPSNACCIDLNNERECFLVIIDGSVAALLYFILFL